VKTKIQERKRRVTIVVDHGHWENKKSKWFSGMLGLNWVPPKPIPLIPFGLKPWDGRPGRFVPETATVDRHYTKMAKHSGLQWRR